MDNWISILLINLIAAIGFMSIVWLLSLMKKDASIADIFWGPGFVFLAWLTFSMTDGYTGRKLLIVCLTTLWGLRLAIHIFIRNLGKGEDHRYRAWRNKHGRRFWWVSFFTVFGLQALLLWIISITTQIGQISAVPSGITLFDGIGVFIWLVGFTFEAVGDWQLARFKSNPENKGKVMDKGLWAYTRHPNYFGETLIWWGLFLITASTPGGVLTIVSPLVITFLLLKVSGVTLLEKTIIETRPKYREYIETTSPFIPWFPGRNRK